MPKFPYRFINATFNYYRYRNFLEVRKFSKVTLIIRRIRFLAGDAIHFFWFRTSLSLISVDYVHRVAVTAFACGKSGENQHISNKKKLWCKSLNRSYLSSCFVFHLSLACFVLVFICRPHFLQLRTYGTGVEVLTPLY